MGDKVAHEAGILSPTGGSAMIGMRNASEGPQEWNCSMFVFLGAQTDRFPSGALFFRP
jgi:hypothetical protein